MQEFTRAAAQSRTFDGIVTLKYHSQSLITRSQRIVQRPVMAEQVQDNPPLERPGIAPDSPDLGTLFGRCMEGFKHLVFALRAPKDTDADVLDHAAFRIGTLKADLIERALDGYARLKVWGHDFRAELPDRARSSLGARLRDKPEMRSQLTGILETLNKQIALGMSVSSSFDNRY